MQLLRRLDLWIVLAGVAAAGAEVSRPPVTFNKNFEGASLGRIEKLDDTVFRCHVEGQHDERGRNRQASWYYFRMDGVADRDLTLTLTDFVGEYNDRPGACPMGSDLRPVFSYDQRTWRHFDQMEWDDLKKEATLRFRPESRTVWIAHVPPYTHSDLLRLLAEINHSPAARVEVIGRTAQARELHLVTVTDFAVPDAGKPTVWLQARQHAWEAPTSHVMEGALRFITSDTPKARELRRKVLFKFTPMMDPDGCATGKVRFNANGYDVNRHWDKVDLRDKQWLEKTPEIWYVKKAILSYLDTGRHIALMINMHNTEQGEFLETMADDAAAQRTMQRLATRLVEQTTFDPSHPLRVRREPSTTTNALYPERGIPVLLMEQRISTSPKLGRRPTVADRLQFGEQLIAVMAEAVRD